MIVLTVCATLFLLLVIVVCVGTMLYSLQTTPPDLPRTEEIRRLRREGLAVHPEPSG